MKNFIFSLLMLIATSSALWADPITFEATVNSPRISLDEALQLTLIFTGVNQDLDPISLPSFDGFSAKYLGESSSVSIVNGDSHSERSLIYNLFPNRVGHFQIPAINATIAGQTYTSKPIDVEVFESSAQAQSQSSSGAGGQNQAPNTGLVKLLVSVDKTEVYLNERVPVSIKLLINGVTIHDLQYPQFDKTGFDVDDFEKPEQSSEIIDGVKYDTVEFKTNIYPGRLGFLPIGPVQIQASVLYKTNQANPFNQDNGFFGTSFNNFFDSYDTRPMSVTATPIQMHILSLPEDNRPQDFSGAIGQFDFEASVSPLQVKVGDPLTLKMDVKGGGNFKSLKIPDFKAAGFKSYEPQIKDVGNEKTSEEVIIPTSTGIKEVPAMHFSYFDPSAKEYKTVSQGPFAIQVLAPSPDQDFKAVGFADVSREPAPLSNQFSFGKMFNEIVQILRKLGQSVWFWLSLGFIFAAGVSYFIWRRFQERLENDPAFARRLKAVREARQALVPAEGYISTGKTKDFYALMSKVLRDYLANKWHQSSAALSVGEIVSHLKAAQLDETLITQVKTLLELADLVCFAGANRDAVLMRSDLLQARDLIAHLEKSLK